VRLIHRSTHGLALTAEATFLDYCQRLTRSVPQAEFAAQAREPTAW
jgi:DNA-binding transcriptional LysR family regulator